MTQADISFETTGAEFDTTIAIVERAEKLGLMRKGETRLDAQMDLAACHANGNPMDFARMLAADDFNFTHDFCGIIRHLDRSTGQLTDFFSPRFSRKQSAEA